MGIVSKGVTLGLAAGGLALFSQAPEFTQQYRQRLGGAIGELKIIVADFDKDAGKSNLSREKALSQMLGSPTPFSRDRGASMTRTITRFDALSRQQALMEKAHPVTRPLFILRTPDRAVLNGAWEIFEPALPFTLPGAVYGALGALLATIFARIGVNSARAVARRRAAAAGKAGKRPTDVNIDPAADAALPGSGAAVPFPALPLPALRPGSGPVPQRYPPFATNKGAQTASPQEVAPDFLDEDALGAPRWPPQRN